jgi:hypothetical protein
MAQTSSARALSLVGAFGLLLAACGTNSSTLIGAGLTTAIGVGASMASRADGGCYANCTAGTVCNPGTGFCERMTCGECGPHQICDESGAVPQCVEDPEPAASAAQPPVTQPGLTPEE